MGVRQGISGNPETKYVWLTEEFTGGVNIAYADDNTADSEFRQLLNYNLDSRGALEKRKGYTRNTGLTELLFSDKYGAVPEFPMFSRNTTSLLDSDVKNIVLFKFLDNTNNIWALLGEMESVEYFQSRIVSNQFNAIYVCHYRINTVTTSTTHIRLVWDLMMFHTFRIIFC